MIGSFGVNQWAFVYSDYLAKKGTNTITYGVDVTGWRTGRLQLGDIREHHLFDREEGRCEDIMVHKNPAGKWERRDETYGNYRKLSAHEYPEDTLIWENDNGDYVNKNKKVEIPKTAKW